MDKCALIPIMLLPGALPSSEADQCLFQVRLRANDAVMERPVLTALRHAREIRKIAEKVGWLW